MNNQEEYKREIENIHPSENLVNSTIQKAIENTSRNKPKSKLRNIIPYTIATLSACAAIFILVFNIMPLHRTEPTTIVASNNPDVVHTEVPELIKPFSSQEELEQKVTELKDKAEKSKGSAPIVYDDMDVLSDSVNSKSINESTSSAGSNYSKTNIQVDGVDEADKIKTDGDNIYIVKTHSLYVLDKDLKLVNDDFEDEDIYLNNLYITSNRIIVMGSGFKGKNEDDLESKSKYYTDTIVLDKDTCKELRRVSTEGYYLNSRLIGNNIYVVTNTSVGTVIDNLCKTPQYIDTASSDAEKCIPYSDVYSIEEYETANYVNICAFDIEDDQKLNYKSFLGFGNGIYCSGNYMYFYNNSYKGNSCVDIIKMKINNTNLDLVAMATLDGEVNNQFSLDEYKGNLRVATTEYEEEYWDDETPIKNHLYILDESLNTIGQTEDFGLDEKIYSVRFIGDVGYVVTFKEVDPLFVMDLSDPTNPVIKGELKVPGFSTYLHPYDETHIIGIGRDIKSNGVNRLKMSMFDVSNLTNPKELYSVYIGDGKYSYSPVTDDHRALLYDAERSLIGFPANSDGQSGFVIYKIENEGFKKKASIIDKSILKNVSRIIYIDDVVYALDMNKIVSFDINTTEKENFYTLEKKR